MTRNVVERIQRFNQGRDPERLQLKYQRMRADSFAFFRGTCHLFYEDWPLQSRLNQALPVWICGDLHLENFGSYKGDNRLVYFDLNDFDESALAPCTWELARFVLSILVAAHTLKLNESEALALCIGSLNAYVQALEVGKARSVEAATAEGMVKELLDGIQQRKRKDFLDKRTQKKDGKRKLIPDHKRIAPIMEDERSRVESFMKQWAAQQAEAAFFELLDVAHRIAGIGSLGVDRYILLVEGQGSPDQNYVLDLKEARASSLQPYLSLPQPHWANQAERIVAIQQRVQGTCPALLSPVVLNDNSYVLRELQPIEDKIDLGNWHGKLQRLERMIETMAELIAWGQLRSGGRQGSAIADDLMAFAHAPNWQDDLLGYAKAYAIQVETDYREFCSNSMF